jgi:transposase
VRRKKVMPHECRETCRLVRVVQAAVREGVPLAKIAKDLKRSVSRVRELVGNYNWDSRTRKRVRICEDLPFDG